MPRNVRKCPYRIFLSFFLSFFLSTMPAVHRIRPLHTGIRRRKINKPEAILSQQRSFLPERGPRFEGRGTVFTTSEPLMPMEHIWIQKMSNPMWKIEPNPEPHVSEATALTTALPCNPFVLIRGISFLTRLNKRPAKTDQPAHPYSPIRVFAVRPKTLWIIGSLATHKVPCEDSDQTARMRRQICLHWAFNAMARLNFVFSRHFDLHAYNKLQ